MILMFWFENRSEAKDRFEKSRIQNQIQERRVLNTNLQVIVVTQFRSNFSRKTIFTKLMVDWIGDFANFPCSEFVKFVMTAFYCCKPLLYNADCAAPNIYLTSLSACFVVRL